VQPPGGRYENSRGPVHPPRGRDGPQRGRHENSRGRIRPRRIPPCVRTGRSRPPRGPDRNPPGTSRSPAIRRLLADDGRCARAGREADGVVVRPTHHDARIRSPTGGLAQTDLRETPHCLAAELELLRKSPLHVWLLLGRPVYSESVYPRAQPVCSPAPSSTPGKYPIQPRRGEGIEPGAQAPGNGPQIPPSPNGATADWAGRPPLPSLTAATDRAPRILRVELP
jgi:hypothetical protein